MISKDIGVGVNIRISIRITPFSNKCEDLFYDSVIQNKDTFNSLYITGFYGKWILETGMSLQWSRQLLHLTVDSSIAKERSFFFDDSTSFQMLK